jgi:hypothetical protein
MTQPSVTITEIDGALGVLPEGVSQAYAVAGVSSDGPINTPTLFARENALEDAFGRGPGVSAAALMIATKGLPVLFTRVAEVTAGYYLDEVAAVDGTISAFDNTAVSGTSDFSDNSSDPLLAGDWQIVALAGGTRGTPGIVFQIFRDNESFGIVALDSAVTFNFGGGSGISVALSAGTIVQGDIATFSTEAPIEASAGELVIEGEGSSAVTLAAIVQGVLEPRDDYECYLEVLTAGTIGVSGITVSWSLDDGRTMSPPVALGTNAYFVFPDSGGVRINFGAGTVLAGQTISFPTVAPRWSSSTLNTALIAMKASSIAWEIAHIVGPLVADDVDVIDLRLADKRHCWIASTRLPVGDETEGAYAASVSAAFEAKSTVYGEVCSGACEPVDPLTGFRLRRPAAFEIGVEEASVEPEINIADPNRAALKCSIKNAAGNPKHHDETTDPGLQDGRFSVLRTWQDGPQGVFPNLPLLLSPAGSDFRLMCHRRLLNLAHRTVTAFFTRRLNQPTEVNRTTGFLTAAEKLEMESGANAALATAFATRKTTATVSLSSDDNLLSVAPLTGRYRVIPPAYIEQVVLEGGFENPANNIVTT